MCGENMQQIRGFAAEFKGARLCIRVAIAQLVWVRGMQSNTCSKSNPMYGSQHRTNTEINNIQKIIICTEKDVPRAD